MTMNPEDFQLQLTAGSIKGAMQAAGAGSKDLWLVPRSKIVVLPNFNVRDRNPTLAAHIRWIADSIKAEGYYMHEAMAGYVAEIDGENKIVLIDGHCRLEGYDLAAAEGADLEGRIPMVVAAKGTANEADLTVALIKTNSGKELTPIEKGYVVKRLLRFGWEERQVAERLGYSLTYVKDLLELIAARSEIRQMVSNEEVSATHAIKVIKMHGAKAYDVLQAGLKKAHDAGKKSVTGRHMADPRLRFMKKSATELFTAVSAVKADPSFRSLAPATRDQLELLLRQIEEAAKPKVKPSSKIAGSHQKDSPAPSA